jgi:hypothetical protein
MASASIRGVTFAGSGTQTVQPGSGASLDNVLYAGSGTLQLTSALTVDGTFTAGSGILDLPTSSTGTLTVGASVTFAAAATLPGQVRNGDIQDYAPRKEKNRTAQ